eukprot:6514887-Alexandrium_andersonii.AAC.1
MLTNVATTDAHESVRKIPEESIRRPAWRWIQIGAWSQPMLRSVVCERGSSERSRRRRFRSVARHISSWERGRH